jgi:hypothetical protein
MVNQEQPTAYVKMVGVGRAITKQQHEEKTFWYVASD